MKKGEKAQVEIDIKEFISLTPEAYRGLWGFFASLSEQVSRIRYLAPPDEPLFDVIIEPREKDFKRPFFEFKSYASICSGFMARLVNLEEAMKLFTTANAPDGEVVIEINDPLIPENNLKFKITVEDLNVSAQKTNNSADVKTDIGTFTQIISGFVKSTSLYQTGKIQGRDKDLKFLDSLFTDSLPFMFQFDIF